MYCGLYDSGLMFGEGKQKQSEPSECWDPLSGSEGSTDLCLAPKPLGEGADGETHTVGRHLETISSAFSKVCLKN